ncbi:MAG: branched-chain amino acid ABC transporter permease [Fibrobacteres bacterium]|nr:branched-chain amino acid ABC transporter permease [Fibrobacterota bacterium]
MNIELILQFILAGITVGSIYAVTAIGYNIVYNATGIINFAQGEFLMLGAMTAIAFAPFLPLPLAIAAGVVIAAMSGMLLDFLFIRRMKNPTVLKLTIITISLSILMREAALHIWDEKVRSLPYFTGNAISTLNLFGARVSYQTLWVLGGSTLMMVALSLFFKYTLTGKAMRACSANRKAALLCGIPAGKLTTLAFVLAAATAAFAGCLMSPITSTQYDCGTPLAIKGFAAAVFGGLGNSGAAVAAGIIIGLLETFSVIFLPAAYKDAVSIALLLIVLFIRPSGLFGSREAGRLKAF